ncbi:hypothetical protein AX15_006834 [Amanita polypyramis BW_CC]|nr:hypothetical protein AX15_006834 [Amanita polypyramis BW_CC]
MLIYRLAPLVESGKVWAALLQDGQNEGTLVRTCQLLVLLGSHPPLSRELVHVSGVSSKDRDELVEPGRLFLVDRLCTFLYEENHKFNELHTIREHILTLFATLSLSDPDSLTALTNNDVLIPSLVCLLSNLTNLLWEEDERLMTAPQPVAALIHMTNQVVTLIHHLVVSMESSFNLKPRVHHNSHQALTGLNHIFIVSFGRLSYADPPDWIDKPGRRELESLTDIARELLDIVVDGPESDYIWSLYQEDPDKNESEADEGEIEARLLGD